ncbi:MAG: hypothetical protein CR986_10295 [Ignavibacteriae bacterium]|nr:MAG: hypothetical protein CR986_10295 [Ignavibacteriota bacterium]
MNKVIIIFLMIFTTTILAQEMPRHRHFGKRFEELEKLKLLEILDLDEETAIKFFIRRKKSRERVNKYSQEMHKVFRKIEKALEDNDKSQYGTLIERSTKIENKIIGERSFFIDSLKDILTEEQILKVILFDHKFKKEIRNLLLERGRKNFFKEKH